ncbi:hypothetical protein YC2023_004761 [Brassica napus]
MGHDPWVDPTQFDPLTQMNCSSFFRLTQLAAKSKPDRRIDLEREREILAEEPIRSSQSFSTAKN